MTSAVQFLRGWFAEPPPPFELRQPNPRWATGRARESLHRLRVAAVIRETPSTRTFVLESPDGGPPGLSYRAGQHLTLVVNLGERTERRCYSFSSSPASGGLPSITVKRTSDGLVSRHLHEQLQAGDTIVATEPAGAFTLELDPAASRHLVLVAGGVGITPLISIAETVLRLEPESRVTLLCGNRDQREIIFGERLDSLAARFGRRLDLQHALDDAPDGWSGLQGALDGQCVLHALGPLVADAYFVCGPEAMMQSVCTALESAGVPRQRIRTERFTYASAATTRIPQHGAEVTFAASGRRVRTRPGQTLLQAGLEAGLDLPYSCTMGGCGACKVRRSAGTVVMSEPNCLSDAERAAGYLLACCSYADADVVIEDL
jgi:ferredoxin-NADP reductase